MLTRFSLNNESEMRAWDAFVESHPQGTPFHLSTWIRVIYETYSYDPILYVYKNGERKMSGIFPCFILRGIVGGVRIVSIPFSDYGGPLFNVQDEENEVLSEILRGNHYRLKCLEIRSPLTAGKQLVCYNYYKRHLINLSLGPDELKKNIDKRTVLYSIRKAERSKVMIKEENTRWGMKEFYRLNSLTRKKHGIPCQPLLFLDKIYEHMVLKGIASILLAIYDSKAVAAGVFLKLRKTVYYKYNASDPFFLPKVTPNHLLTWAAVEKACAEGYHYFDFGRTSPDNEGLMRYKKMWGAEQKDLPYYYYPRLSGATSRKEKGLPYRLFTNLWRRLPEGTIEIIGPRLFRFFG